MTVKALWLFPFLVLGCTEAAVSPSEQPTPQADTAPPDDAPQLRLEDCSDGTDNDGDTQVDCQDADCWEHPDCIEDCTDGVDNDGDGRSDCADRDCAGTDACIEDCSDGADNDLDGATDCADTDCAEAPGCIEVCSDGVDNDGDGLADCEDADCSKVCSEASCVDGMDNDADGFIDCQDAECWGLEDCGSPQAYLWAQEGVYSVTRSSWAYDDAGIADRQRFEMRLQGNPAGVLYSTGLSGTQSCTWRAESWVVSQSSQGSGMAGRATGQGVALSEGCPFDPEGFDLSVSHSAPDAHWPFSFAGTTFYWSGQAGQLSWESDQYLRTMGSGVTHRAWTTKGASFYGVAGFLSVREGK